MSPLESDPPQKERLPHSIWGIASFCLAILPNGALSMLILFFILVGLCGGRIYIEDTTGMPIVLYGAIAYCSIMFVAFIFGIVGIFRPRTRKVFSVLGLILSAPGAIFGVYNLILLLIVPFFRT
jgi:hypothetical protein